MSVQKTRALLVDVARQLFAKNGFEDTSMNDIAVAANRGRRTLYTYFNSKEEIYLAVIQTELERLYERMEEVARNDPRASFGFIGANKLDESEANTKRFRVYRRFMLTNFGNTVYEHYENWEKSAYLLVNRKEMEEHPGLLDEVVKGFRELYPYFD